MSTRLLYIGVLQSLALAMIQLPVSALVCVVEGCSSEQASGKGLDARQLTHGLQQMGYNVGEEEVQSLIRQVDTSKTGHLQVAQLVASLIDWKALQVR